MKILVFNGAITPVTTRAGEDWEHRRAALAGATRLHSDSAEQIPDYDVFIADNGSLLALPGTPVDLPVDIHTAVFDRVVNHGFLLCFVSSESLSWVSQSIVTTLISGEEVSVSSQPSPLSSVLEGLKKEMTYKVQLTNNKKDPVISSWEPVAFTKDGKAVAVHVLAKKGHIFLVPQFKRRGEFVRRFLDRVVPLVEPRLALRPEVLNEREPDWVSAYEPIVKVQEWEKQLQSIEKTLKEQQRLHEEVTRERDELRRFTRLLWYDGHTLQELVKDALVFLGIQAYILEPVDVTIDLEGEAKLYIEVEGSTTGIKKKKGAQLLSYIEADDPDGEIGIKGCLVLNPYRLERPQARSRAGRQPPPLGPQLVRLAESQNWPIIMTVQLYKWVKEFADGDTTITDKVRKALGID